MVEWGNGTHRMIHLLYGPDEFSRQEALERLLRAALPAELADLNTTRLAAGEVTVDALRFACEAAPFLADRRAVLVTGLIGRLTARRGRAAEQDIGDDGTPAKGLAAEIAAYLPRVPANTLLVLLEGDAPPKTGALAKALTEAQAKTQAFPLLAGPPLSRWIRERAKSVDSSISDRAADLLATYVGGDLRALANELAKLATYVGPGRTIDLEDVSNLVNQVRESTIFELVDAVAQGNRKGALVALHQLLEDGERPERVLIMLGRQVRLLLQARELRGAGYTADAIGRELALSQFPLRKVMEQTRRFELPRLEAMHRRVLQADVSIKTGQQEPDLALELLVTELAAAGTPARPSESARRPAFARR